MGEAEGMKRICDLHTHSNYSDGTWTPEQLIREAEALGLEALALCDHNTLDGLPNFLAAAAGSKVHGVPGIEFSTDYRGGELHILALFVRPEHYTAIEERLMDMMIRKEQSNRNLIAALQQAGIRLDYKAIKAGTASGQVNRAIIAAEMVRQGYCGSIREAFKTWLSPEYGYYVPPKRPDAHETIRFIHSIGAVSVLAHPFLNLEEEELCQFLSRAEELDAMETEYVTFTPEQRARAREIAAQFGLLCSGGSDFHGDIKPDIRLGTGRGDLVVDAASSFRRLQERGKQKLAQNNCRFL